MAIIGVITMAGVSMDMDGMTLGVVPTTMAIIMGIIME
jgi:hypothetical protein